MGRERRDSFSCPVVTSGPIRNVLRAEMAKLFHPHIYQPLGLSHQEKGVTLGKGAGGAEKCLLTALPVDEVGTV